MVLAHASGLWLVAFGMVLRYGAGGRHVYLDACSIQEGKEHLAELIDNYIMEKIVFADRIIAKNSAAKIGSNDVVLVYGRASAVEAGLLRAHKDGTRFRGVRICEWMCAHCKSGMLEWSLLWLGPRAASGGDRGP